MFTKRKVECNPDGITIIDRETKANIWIKHSFFSEDGACLHQPSPRLDPVKVDLRDFLREDHFPKNDLSESVLDNFRNRHILVEQTPHVVVIPSKMK